MSAHASSGPQDTETDLRLRVDDVRQCADDVLSFELVETDGATLPNWSPGAHVDVQLAGGLVRQYSLCGDPRVTAAPRSCTRTCV